MLLSEYDPRWPQWFSALSVRIAPALGKNYVAIHHVGSTAIPCIIAKPIIDMIIEIEDYSSFDTVATALAGLGYTCEGDLGINDRIAFKRKNDTVPYGEPARMWTAHHLYVCPSECEELKRHIAFRDYLIRHEEVREEYAAIKKQIESESSGDRKTYAKIKEARAAIRGVDSGESACGRRDLKDARTNHTTPHRLKIYAPGRSPVLYLAVACPAILILYFIT
jgi:GrpB-like predicted nucleotidyltransferase (UPF0157 family)